MPVYDFAVYSSDDGSLTLYHRRRTLLPLKGMVFEENAYPPAFESAGKAVTMAGPRTVNARRP